MERGCRSGWNGRWSIGNNTIGGGCCWGVGGVGGVGGGGEALVLLHL